jgi:hypothetical protein
MLENILVALTNLYGFRAYFYCSKFEQSVLLSAMISSIIYHLIEHHKHGMPGISFFNSVDSHIIFLNIDRLYAVICFLTFFEVNMLNDQNLVICFGTGLFMMFLSEMIFKTPKYKYAYMITHCMWHFLAFHTIYLLRK